MGLLPERLWGDATTPTLGGAPGTRIEASGRLDLVDKGQRGVRVRDRRGELGGAAHQLV